MHSHCSSAVEITGKSGQSVQQLQIERASFYATLRMETCFLIWQIHNYYIAANNLWETSNPDIGGIDNRVCYTIKKKIIGSGCFESSMKIWRTPARFKVLGW